MRMTAEDKKLYFYRFDQVCLPTDRIPLVDTDDMRRVIDRAIKLKETVTIVDEDNELIFRSERGIVSWPRVRQYGVAS